jgi:hypothetical protein
MRGRGNFHTVYHVMEQRGVFATNPANIDSIDQAEGTPLYKGPVPYPRMFYHPEGKERVIAPGEVVVDPIQGPIRVGELREIIHQLAENAEDEERLRREGWHDHPARAMAAAGKEAPPISSQQHIDGLQSELDKLRLQLAAAQQEQKPEKRASAG